MSNQTMVFSALATSQQIGFAIPFIDVNTLQPTLDSGNVNGLPTGGGLVYVENVSGGPANGVGALSVGTSGDYTGTDPINSGWQIDSYVPTTSQSSVAGAVPGHTVSVSRGTRYIPQVVANNDYMGEFSGYGYVIRGSTYGYSKLAGVNMYVSGADVNFPGGEMRFATREDGGVVITEWAKLTNGGNFKLSGSFSPPPLNGVAGAFQSTCQIYAVVGVPDDALGANGDICFQSDGGVGSCIYQKRAGVWVATGA